MSGDLYQQAILEEARRAAGDGPLERPDVVVERDNPLCGDRIRLEARLLDGRIAQVGHVTRGCLLTRAAASLLARLAPGRSPEELRTLRDRLRAFLAGETEEVEAALAMFRPVREVRSRHDCVLLPFEAAAELAEREGRPR